MSEGHVSADTLAEQEQNSNQEDDGEFIIQDYSNSMVQGENVTVSEPVEDEDTEEGKNYVQLDMVNYTLVRCHDNDDTTPEYRLVAALGTGEEGQQNITRVDGVLPDGTMYVLDESGVGEVTTQEGGGGGYVTVVNRGASDAQGTLMIMEYATADHVDQPLQQEQEQQVKEETIEEDTSAALLAQVSIELPLTDTPSIKKAKMLARKRSALPPAHVLLSSPNFKPYLYSCKQCDYKCNSMREMSSHKKEGHTHQRAYDKSPQRASANLNQFTRCGNCGAKYYSTALLSEHMKTCKSKAKHAKRKNSEREEAEHIDLLQCGLCGFETADKPQFHRHVIKHRKLSGRIVTSSHKPNH